MVQDLLFILLLWFFINSLKIIWKPLKKHTNFFLKKSISFHIIISMEQLRQQNAQAKILNRILRAESTLLDLRNMK